MDERKKRHCDTEAPSHAAAALPLSCTHSLSGVAETLTPNLIWNYMKKNNVTVYELM